MRSPELQRLLEIMREASFKSSPEPVFPLVSGVKSRFYIDCKMSISDPEALQLIGELIAQRVQADEIDAVGGLELGAYPIATAVSSALFKRGRRTRAFVVRKQPKGHGLGKQLEGNVRRGDVALIVDDVITSGGSTVVAIERSRDEGLTVNKAIALVDREEQGGRERIEATGVAFESLFRIHDFL